MAFSAAVPLIAGIPSLCQFSRRHFTLFHLWAQGKFFQPDFLTNIWALLLHSLKPAKILNEQGMQNQTTE